MKLSGRVVVDASVVLECLGEFRHPVQARRLLRTYADDASLELWAPDLVYVEVLSALRRLAALNAISEQDGVRAIDRLLNLPLDIAGTAPLLSDAWDLRHSITAYDACYVALASRLEGVLITADESLERARISAGEPVLALRDLG